MWHLSLSGFACLCVWAEVHPLKNKALNDLLKSLHSNNYLGHSSHIIGNLLVEFFLIAVSIVTFLQLPVHDLTDDRRCHEAQELHHAKNGGVETY